MPEWPEMEHYRRNLERLIGGRIITEASIQREKSVNLPAAEFIRRVAGQRIMSVQRSAKMLILPLASGDALLAHLMLGGALFFGRDEEKPNRTVQVRLSFGDRHLHFIGLRLGYLHLLGPAELEQRLNRIGPDPFDPALDPAALAARLARKRGAVKAALTDQAAIAGIGNCYSDEICFAASLLPSRRPSSLAASDWTALHGAMRQVLSEAVAAGGYMEMPLFAGDALTGGYDARCRVYDREGEPCVRCGAPIQRRDIGARKSFCCTGCQR